MLANGTLSTTLTSSSRVMYSLGNSSILLRNMRITLKDVEEKIKPLGKRLSYDKEFIFELLAAYGRAPGNITRLRNGQLNVANDKSQEVAQKGVIYFKPVSASDDDLYAIIDDLKTDPTVVRYSTRFVVVTNYNKLLAIDIRTGEPLDISIREIDQYYAYFLPWAGMEKAQFIAENHADVKAAEKMAKLFDILIAHNRYTSADEWHTLTIFFTRLLFCFFAEDTNIFGKNQFINAIASYTQEDGSDIKDFLHLLFDSLDTSDKSRYPAHLAAFPYVNGRLFSDFTDIPAFNKQARDLLLESASRLDWSEINPDIFGSMFQAVVQPGERTSLGQHYTSVPNIMKTIEPLFLDELKDELNNSYEDVRKLEKLLARISKIKIFDPACGTGNFLIIAYKELRRLEHAILERQAELTGQSQQILFGSRVNIENFYGIEIDDFPHEVAILSLWLAKHQMNLEFTEKFGIDLPLIPLRESGNIVHANAARIDWCKVCPIGVDDEVYIIGNPPYLGARRQTESDKRDMDFVFSPVTNRYKNLDYVSIWFYKASRFLAKNNHSAAALVSINSISQGQQIELIWPLVLTDDICIDYAYTSFKWTNNAKNAAKVTCVIVAFSSRGIKHKFIESPDARMYVEDITPYLENKKHDNIVGSRSIPISRQLPKMEFGNMPLDGGALILNDDEKNLAIEKDPGVSKYLKRLYGSKEYINDIKRWCLWIEESDSEDALQHVLIRDRVEKVRQFRLDSKDKGTQRKASKPYWFREHKQALRSALIIPRVSSERRSYIPVGYLSPDQIISDSAQVIYDPELWIFGFLTSRMHMNWVRSVAGQLETRIRYSSAIVYNNFPVPTLTEAEKIDIEGKSFAVLDARENHAEKTLADMYDPDKMPDDLRAAHYELDEAVDAVYRKKPFGSDEERLAHLFDLYETMTANERKKS